MPHNKTSVFRRGTIGAARKRLMRMAAIAADSSLPVETLNAISYTIAAHVDITALGGKLKYTQQMNAALRLPTETHGQ